MSIHPENSPDDPYIGLDVGGKRFYCFRSTLTNASSSYFSARFDGRMGPGCVYKDEFGRNVYCIDRNSAPFEYILEYLRTPNALLPASLPGFYENRPLWRSLRVEAVFFGLDGLSALLQVTYSCSPKTHGNCGVLHWIGTMKGTRHEYQNPFKIGAIHVGGWVDMSKAELEAQGGLDICTDYARTSASRALLVQHCPKATITPYERFTMTPGNFILFCDHAGFRNPVVVDLRTITLQPSHFSIRFEVNCGGMWADWNLEGSLDSLNWNVLFKHRCQKKPSFVRNEVEDFFENIEDDLEEEDNEDKISDLATSFVESRFRRTWALQPTPTQFYRYFRIIGAGDSCCLHGLGFELFGNVHEA